MANVEHRDTARLQAKDDVLKFEHFLTCQDRGRFVKNDHLVLVEERLRNLHKLLVGERDGAHDRVRRNGATNFRQPLRGHPAHLPIVDEAPAAEIAAKEEIFRHGQGISEEDLLMDQSYAGLLRLPRPGECDLLTIRPNLALGRLDVTGEDAH